jgi:hypothetical protein
MPSPLPENMAGLDMVDLYEKYPSLEAVETTVNHRLNARKNIVGLFPKRAVGAEVGVFTGVLSEFILKTAAPRKFYMVDPWHKAYGERFPSWGRYTDSGRLTTEAALGAARYRASQFAAAEIVVSSSIDWLKSLPDGHLDWIYLDSSHRYDDTLSELRAIAPKLKRHGMIFGDDAWTERGNQHYGVFQAITDFCKIRPYELFRLDHAAQWAIRRQPDT